MSSTLEKSVVEERVGVVRGLCAVEKAVVLGAAAAATRRAAVEDIFIVDRWILEKNRRIR